MSTPAIRTIVSPLDPWSLFKRVYSSASECFFLDSHTYAPPNQRFSYIGWDPVLRITATNHRFKVQSAHGGSRSYSKHLLFPVLRNILKKYPSRPASSPNDFFRGGLMGFCGYEMASWFEAIRFRRKRKSGQPLLLLGLYQNLIVYDHLKKVYYLLAPSPRRNRKKKTESLFARHKAFFQAKDPLVTAPFRLNNFKSEMKRSQFIQMVKKAKRYIQAGDIYQANLSQRFSFHFQGSTLEIYERLRVINPSPFASFYKAGELELLSSSPERLVLKRGEYCETQPIAGTRPRSAAGKTEKQLEKELRENAKENAEHLMLVDLERNDLARVCRWPSVRVLEMKTVERYSHVLHLVSRIAGQLKKGKDAWDLLRAMFPGGTITGCPKIRCMQIIDELEPVERGAYTGSLGYIDYSGNADWNIIIRTLVLKRGKGVFQVGAGIVHDSDPRFEFEETLHKGEALMHALAQASRSRS